MRKSVIGLLMVLGVVVAFAASGFAHRAPDSGHDSLLAFALAGGSVHDLCADTGDDGKPQEPCQVCHLIGTADVPATDIVILRAEFAFQASVIAPRESRALRMVRDPAHGLRAPPIA